MSIDLNTMPKLGFGLMRLPERDGRIDLEQVCRMADAYLDAGLNYFDTAYVYHGGNSEKIVKEALAKRHPRDSYTVATKLPAWCMKAEADRDRIFNEQLERCGLTYFDFYLLHSIEDGGNGDTYDRLNCWDWAMQKKAEGKIRHFGFSFHGSPEYLERLLDEHPEVEFVQIQLNYADWENPGVASRRNWEICKAHGKPVMIMEPVKGGILADPIPEVKSVFDASGADVSYASWALRFAAGLDNVHAVLSGMSSEQQMEDNLSFMKDFRPLDEHEEEVIREAQKAFDEDKSIPCTACHYCTKGCPMGIPIPEIFTVENRRKGSPEFRTTREYVIVTVGKGKASDCIQCGQCEAACPQHLPIITLLEQCRSLEG